MFGFSSKSPEIKMVMQGLYIGNEDAAHDLETIEKYKIRAICVCGSQIETPFKNKKMVGRFENIKYIQHEVHDVHNQKIMHLFDENSEWIEQRLNEGRNVLVHCVQGISRSATFIIAYLMSKRNMSYDSAYTHLKEQRKSVQPNPGFKDQLLQYEQLIKETKERKQ